MKKHYKHVKLSHSVHVDNGNDRLFINRETYSGVGRPKTTDYITFADAFCRHLEKHKQILEDDMKKFLTF